MPSPVRVALLERLSGTVSRHAVEDPGAVMRSVFFNLRRVLNSREGAAGANMEFGLPSPHELLQNWPGSQATALAAVRRCLQRYEPRLTDVTVRPVPYSQGDTAISFQISARLIGPTRTPVTLTTALSSDGRVNLR